MSGAGRKYPPRPVVGVGAIILRRGRVLLVQRGRAPGRGLWSLPGGAVEPGERLEDAVRREVREETGLEVVVERLVGVYGKPGRNELVFAFQCRITGGALQPTDESDETRYFAVDAMPPNTLLKHAERVWDARQAHDQPVIRKQGSPRRPEKEP